MDTYDEAAFDQFCAELVNAEFSPVAGTNQSRWTGPIRLSLQRLTEATTMQVHIHEGWPLRYAHIKVRGLKTEHAGDGVICLWADDDPAQIEGRDLGTLWDRLDEWADVAQRGFRDEDQALDAYRLWHQDDRTTYQAELPMGDFVRQGHTGLIVPLVGRLGGQGQRTFFLGPATRIKSKAKSAHVKSPLRGAFYLHRRVEVPPCSLAEIRAALTRGQAKDLDRGLSAREPVGVAEPSGGYDFIVFAWPRHGQEHDALVVAFQSHADSLKGYAMAATSNDIAARLRRAGPDTDILKVKKVVVAGAGSVGGYVALSLASSGVAKLRIHDDDYLKTANLVRHACPESSVGYNKALAVGALIDDHAPWTDTEPLPNLPFNPDALAAQVADADLVVDCTGDFSMAAALAEICSRTSVDLISGALFHQGALLRVQRQAAGDTPIAARRGNPNYPSLPPVDPTSPNLGFLELGCTAPVNNAPPTAVAAAAAEISHAAIDLLTSRKERSDESIVVLRPMEPPFDRIGPVHRHGVEGSGS